MTLVHRVLSPDPIGSLDEYLERGGGAGLEAARKVEPEALVGELEASGLRGRGGAGFPTGRKWRTVLENRSTVEPPTVVVNGAEGEPGTYKDRTILRNNPHHVIEGALIAARAVGAVDVVFALKRSFTTEVARLRAAIDEWRAADIVGDVTLEVFEGPGEYLYGEETALLETIDGRYPFPRISPPYRRGVDEVVDSPAEVDADSGLSARVEMAGPTGESVAPPALVDNVETMANVPGIIGRGAAWFRTEGTERSPGTIVCTVTGSTQRAGVGEVMMGTPLREIIEDIGGGARPGHQVVAVMGGVSASLIPASALDTPATYEDMAAIGSGLGSGGFTVFDDTDDLAAVAAGVARFLAVESCGQCLPCKQDGLTLADLLERVCRSEADEHDLETIAHRLDTVGDGARCALAGQQQTVVGSIMERFGDQVRAHVDGGAPPVDPVLVTELLAVDGDEAVLDEGWRRKQPDWTFDEEYSGQMPADRLDDHHAPQRLET